MILSPFELAQIANEVGPTDADGRWGVWEKAGKKIPKGGSFVDSPGVLLGVWAGRIRWAGDMNPEQRAKMGLGTGLVEADTVLSFAPGGWAKTGCVVRRVPEEWQGQTFLVAGTIRRAVTNDPDPDNPSQTNPVLFRVMQGGTTGASEPAWNTGASARTEDGDVIWVCEGPSPDYAVVAELGPSTFGDYLGRKYALQSSQGPGPSRL